VFTAICHLALRSWFAMVAAFSTNTLGFLLGLFGVAFCIWMANVLWDWWRFRQTYTGVGGLFTALSKSIHVILAEFVGVSVFLLVCWTSFVIRTIYFDHTGLQYANSVQMTNSGQSSAAAAQEIARLRAQVEFQQNNITTQEPVFINIRDLLQAFAVFRNDLNKESCVVKITAPPQTEPLASVVGNFSIATSNCPTFGPMLGDMDPDETAATMRGMIPDAIVFHAARDDKAANELFMRLSNQIKLVRSYELPSVNYQTPAGGYVHTVWLQFGSKVKWNSEIH
jgi:hypothetical protein